MKKTNEIRFKNGFAFYKFVEMYSNCVEECKIKIKDGKFSIQAMDSQRIALYSAEGTMEEYEKDQEIGINLVDFKKILKTKKGFKKEFRIKFHEDELRIEKTMIEKRVTSYSMDLTSDRNEQRQTFVKTLKGLDLEKEDVDLGFLSKIQYDTKFTWTKKDLDNFWDEAGFYSEIFTVESDPKSESISFSEEGVMGRMESKIGKVIEMGDRSESSSYSLTYFAATKNLLSVMSTSDEVVFELKQDTPLHVSLDVKAIDVKFNYWMAPKVEDEEFDEGEGDENEF